MTTIKEAAQAYEPKQTKNIADLKRINATEIILHKVVDEGKSTQWEYNYVEIDDVEYRVPDSVLKQLKIHVAANSDFTHFQVVKEGTGKTGTTYTVVPLKADDAPLFGMGDVPKI